MELTCICMHQTERAHALCNDCFSQRDTKVRMIDFVSGEMDCCVCGKPEARRWAIFVEHPRGNTR